MGHRPLRLAPWADRERYRHGGSVPHASESVGFALAARSENSDCAKPLFWSIVWTATAVAILRTRRGRTAARASQAFFSVVCLTASGDALSRAWRCSVGIRLLGRRRRLGPVLAPIFPGSTVATLGAAPGSVFAAGATSDLLSGSTAAVLVAGAHRALS